MLAGACEPARHFWYRTVARDAINGRRVLIASMLVFCLPAQVQKEPH